VVSGTRFADRKGELREIRADLASGQHLIVMSPRRWGKTSLLLKVLDGMKRDGPLPVYLDVMLAPTAGRFAELFSRELARVAGSRMDEVVRMFRSLLPSLVPRLVWRAGPVPEVSIEPGGFPGNLDRLLDEVLEAPQKLAQKKRKRLVVVLDEFQETAGYDGGGFHRRLRSLWQRHDRVSYCFLGSKRGMLEDLFLKRRNPLYRFGKILELGPMPIEEMERYVNAGFRRTGVERKPVFGPLVCGRVGGHPYFVQMLAHEVWNILALGPKKPRSQESVVDLAGRRIVEKQSCGYERTLSFLSPKQKNLLVALARGVRKGLRSQKVTVEWDLGTPSTVTKNLRALEAKELIEIGPEGPLPADPFLTEWIATAFR